MHFKPTELSVLTKYKEESMPRTEMNVYIFFFFFSNLFFFKWLYVVSYVHIQFFVVVRCWCCCRWRFVVYVCVERSAYMPSFGWTMFDVFLSREKYFLSDETNIVCDQWKLTNFNAFRVLTVASKDEQIRIGVGHLRHLYVTCVEVTAPFRFIYTVCEF